MEEMLGLSCKKYEDEFVNFIQEYLSSLKKIGIFYQIGDGIKLFGKVKVFNLAYNLNSFSISKNNIRELELVTINNPIAKFCESSGYFNVKNKDILITEKYLSI